MNEKNLLEFLEYLSYLTLENIKLLKDNEGQMRLWKYDNKYFSEITQIQELINEFDFVKNVRKENDNG